MGSSFAESATSAEAGLGASPETEPAPALSNRSADDLLRALFEEPLPDEELTDAELDEGDDDSLSTEETLPSEIDTPLMDEIKEEEAGGEA